MTNDELMPKTEARTSSFVIRSLFRHSSFVIRHWAIPGAALLLFAHPSFAVEVLEDIVEQKYDVTADATLSIANIDGSIRIYAAEKPEITILAIKKAYTRERLEGIVVDVKATPNSVSITTSVPPRKNVISDRSGTVDYIIVVPQTAHITQAELTNGELLIEGIRPGGSAKAHVTNGWLGGHNCFANLDLAVETGRLDIAYDWWESHEFSVKAANTRGNIRASFASDASLNLSAMAPEGRIANAFDEKQSSATGIIHSVATVIGPEAGANIALEAGRGNIRIEKTY